MGADGIREASDISVIANNYMEGRLLAIRGITRVASGRAQAAHGDDALQPRDADRGDRGDRAGRAEPDGRLRDRRALAQPRAVGRSGAVHARGRRAVVEGGHRLLDRRARPRVRRGLQRPGDGDGRHRTTIRSTSSTTRAPTTPIAGRRRGGPTSGSTRRARRGSADTWARELRSSARARSASAGRSRSAGADSTSRCTISTSSSSAAPCTTSPRGSPTSSRSTCSTSQPDTILARVAAVRDLGAARRGRRPRAGVRARDRRAEAAAARRARCPDSARDHPRELVVGDHRVGDGIRAPGPRALPRGASRESPLPPAGRRGGPCALHRRGRGRADPCAARARRTLPGAGARRARGLRVQPAAGRDAARGVRARARRSRVGRRHRSDRQRRPRAGAGA